MTRRAPRGGVRGGSTLTLGGAVLLGMLGSVVVFKVAVLDRAALSTVHHSSPPTWQPPEEVALPPTPRIGTSGGTAGKAPALPRLRHTATAAEPAENVWADAAPSVVGPAVLQPVVAPPVEPVRAQPPEATKLVRQPGATQPVHTAVGGGAAGYAADLAAHKANSQCWEHYDLGLLDDWDSKAEQFCVPGGAAVGNVQPSSLTCRVMNDAHLPAATRPHTACDGEFIAVDFAKLTPTKCPQFRRGYKCDGPPIFYRYGPGALEGACRRTTNFRDTSFPRDHLRDIFHSWSDVQSVSSMASVPTADAPVTLFLTRERLEHANLFHSTTDFLNAFEALHMAKVINVHREGDRTGMANVQAVVLDEQGEGPFDDVFKRVFSPNYPVLRVSGIKSTAKKKLLFPKAVFSPPGYTNMLFTHLDTMGDCRERLQLLESFRMFVLNGLGIPPPKPRQQVRIVFISRKPYNKFVNHGFVGRQVSNEPDVLAALNSIPDVSAELVDFVHLTFEEQLRMVANTDVMVGMHGAALSHAVYMPPWGGVIELWPKNKDMWRCFEHLSEMAGLVYRRWENLESSAFHKDSKGDYTRVNIPAFSGIAKSVVEQVVARRATSK